MRMHSDDDAVRTSIPEESVWAKERAYVIPNPPFPLSQGLSPSQEIRKPPPVAVASSLRLAETRIVGSPLLQKRRCSLALLGLAKVRRNDPAPQEVTLPQEILELLDE
jgi:hypothetical protein